MQSPSILCEGNCINSDLDWWYIGGKHGNQETVQQDMRLKVKEKFFILPVSFVLEYLNFICKQDLLSNHPLYVLSFRS